MASLWTKQQGAKVSEMTTVLLSRYTIIQKLTQARFHLEITMKTFNLIFIPLNPKRWNLI